MPGPVAGRLTVSVADPAPLALAGGTSLVPERVAVRVQPVVDANGPSVIGWAVPVVVTAIVAAIVAAVVAALLVVVLTVAAIVAAVVLLIVAAIGGTTTLAEAAIVAAPPVVAETGVAGGGHRGKDSAPPTAGHPRV